MSKQEINRCEVLEKQLSNYKLWADMVPKGSFFQNLRKIFSRTEWDIIRKAVYKKDGHICVICGTENAKLEAHEEWNYIYRSSIQKLESICSLCYWCHRNKHLGHSSILSRKGKLDLDKLISHWAIVNKKPKFDFREYTNKVFDL
ncbi:MAG: hypothetical protein GF317_07565 [Candidatus Lokiarchaeota archaeon]|nr:hypothetical protein [Candidatus Lokiarchaeota archaeon]MBD3199570.1 hypothetical protein [Candidatus Lokiarchaeota archaeon]